MSGTRIVAFALAATMLAALGCGGSKPSSPNATTAARQSEPSSRERQASDQSTSSAQSLSRTQLIAKADTICAGVNAKRSSIKLRSKQDYVTKLPSLAASERTAAASLSTLTPPASMASDWQQIVRATEAIATDTARIIAYGEANNEVAVHRLILDANAAQRQMAALAVRYGFEACGQLA